MDKRFLIIARVGDRSLHASWLQGAEPNFDVFLSYFGDEPEKYKQQCAFYDQQKGGKWPIIGRLVNEYWELIRTYDAVWFPDDDLLADANTLNTLFSLFSGHQLALAQPALTLNSFYTFPALLQKKSCLLRYVNFVEVMAPLMSHDALSVLRETFVQSPSGWGLDSLWPQLINNPHKNRIAIIDATAVTHTRPVGGELYKKNPDLCPAKDVEALAETYAALNIDRRAYKNRFRVYGQLICQQTSGDTWAFIKGKWQKTWSQLAAKCTKRYQADSKI